jgi:PAS domain S-box-containing protein
MKIHKKLTQLASVGMLLVVSTAVLFLPDVGADHPLTARVLGTFVLVLISCSLFLLLFRLYVSRKITEPLKELLKGAEEIGKGNLDYQISVKGTGDIADLARRFNEMARKINLTYTADLEQKVLEQTRGLAALSSIAVELSRAGTLEDMLRMSLSKLFESLPNLHSRGAVFLCDRDGASLRRTAYLGLSPELVQREEIIPLTGCLAKVVRSGEVLYQVQGYGNLPQAAEETIGSQPHVLFPIKSRGIVLGVVFLYPNNEFTLKPYDIQIFQMIGSQLGLAVENFGFYTEAKDASAQFWDLYENARDILFSVDATGKLISVNIAFEDFFGYSKVELIGKNILEFLTHDSAQSAARILAEINLPNVIELEVIKRDTSHAFVEVSGRRLYKGATPAGLHISARDMTEQKNLRAQLVKAERCTAIGQVGIAVRHEINNPLTSVIGNIEILLERSAGKDKDLEVRLEIILNNALRISEIIRRVEGIQQEKVVEYLKGIKMTDLNDE